MANHDAQDRAVSGEGVPMKAPARRTWKKDPPDGTSYSDRVSSDGFVIKTKPRFLPRYGYEVTVPRLLNAEHAIWPIRFDTLGLAKAAAAIESWILQDWVRANAARARA